MPGLPGEKRIPTAVSRCRWRATGDHRIPRRTRGERRGQLKAVFWGRRGLLGAEPSRSMREPQRAGEIKP